jgi:hypothetical protein
MNVLRAIAGARMLAWAGSGNGTGGRPRDLTPISVGPACRGDGGNAFLHRMTYEFGFYRVRYCPDAAVSAALTALKFAFAMTARIAALWLPWMAGNSGEVHMNRIASITAGCCWPRHWRLS